MTILAFLVGALAGVILGGFLPADTMRDLFARLFKAKR